MDGSLGSDLSSPASFVASRLSGSGSCVPSSPSMRCSGSSGNRTPESQTSSSRAVENRRLTCSSLPRQREAYRFASQKQSGQWLVGGRERASVRVMMRLAELIFSWWDGENTMSEAGSEIGSGIGSVREQAQGLDQSHHAHDHDHDHDHVLNHSHQPLLNSSHPPRTVPTAELNRFQQYAQYLLGLTLRVQCTLPQLLLAGIYLQRLRKRYPRARGQTGCAHRLTVAALLVAQRFVFACTLESVQMDSSAPMSDTEWARASACFSVDEIARMEAELVMFLGGRLDASLEDVEHFISFDLINKQDPKAIQVFSAAEEEAFGGYALVPIGTKTSERYLNWWKLLATLPIQSSQTAVLDHQCPYL